MEILRIYLLNLHSLRQAVEIDFSQPPLAETGIFAITGDTGAGKTTLLDAITLALYGRIARNSKERAPKEVMSFGASESIAEVDFRAGAHTYRARWNIRRAHGKAEGNVLGPFREVSQLSTETGQFLILSNRIKEVDLQIEAITGLDYDRFTRSVLLSQGDFAAFLRAGEKERSDLLERITGTAIYSDLSKAAFERHKLEREKLDLLRSQWEQLACLDEDALGLLNQQYQEQTEASQALQGLLVDLRLRLQTRQREADLLPRLLEQKNLLEELQRQQNEAAADRSRYNRSRSLRAEAAAIRQLEADQGRRIEWEQELRELALQSAANEEGLLALEAAYGQAQQTWQDFQLAAASQDALLEQATRLDERLEAAANNLTEAQQYYERAQADKTSLETRIAAAHQRGSELTTRLEELKGWLDGHQAYESLAEQLPLLEQERENLRASFAKRRTEQLALAEDETQYQKLQADSQAAETALNKAKLELQQLLTNYEDALPQGFEPGQEEPLLRLNHAIDQLQKRLFSLEQLAQIDAEYRDLLRERIEEEEQLYRLRSLQDQTGKKLLITLETLDELEPELSYKEQIYRQQQQIANYEKDRLELPDGEPCPLCFSTSHPFRVHAIVPYVDRARQEFEKIQAYYQRLQQESRSLLQEDKELSREIAHLMGDELRQLRGQLDRQLEKMLAYEGRIAALATSTDSATPLSLGSKSEDWPLLAKAAEQQLRDWKSARSRLEKLQGERQKLTEWVSLTEKEYLQKRGEESLLHDRLARRQDSLRDMDEAYEQDVLRINKLLAPLGLSFEAEQARAMFDQLQQQLKQHQQQEEYWRLANEDARLNEASLQQYQQQWLATAQAAAAAAQTQEQRSEDYQKLRAERQEILGGESVIEVKRQQEEVKKAQQLALEESRQAWTQAKEADSIHRQRQADRNEDIRKLAASIEASQQQILGNIKTLGFASLEEAQSALLSSQEEQAIEDQLLALDKQQSEVMTAYQENYASWQLISTQAADWPSLAALEAQQAELETELAQVQQHIGALREQMQQNEHRRQRALVLSEEIAQQQTEYRRWLVLNELIGQADGKKFRTFAQGLTLRKLVALANRHLQQLNGRYLIAKREDAELELEVIDTYQADNRRSALSLSGGESFIASLALALGLSDLAGRDTRIGSLFIDEGFGSLDDNSLDLALATLENLQASGKTIGVISHVKALKERIGTQIQVVKQHSGFSEVKII